MSEITLEITPRSRLDVIDIGALIAEREEGFASNFKKALYCSYHTTAGYLEQSILRRLENRRESVEAYCASFQRIFPPDAGYRHDQMDLRSELSLEQREVEPRNADSHLTYIGAGLENCVTYETDTDQPTYFIDLDGVNGDVPRTRRTTVLGFNREKRATTIDLQIPVSAHAIDSVSLRDPRLGLMDQLNDAIYRLGIGKGRVDLSLDSDERNVGLTVNEYETLLMRHDLADVLRNPLRYMAEKGRNMLRDPRAIPSKAKNYAKYDFVQVLNEIFDTLGMSESIVERAVDRLMAVPAERFFRMKRSVSLLVNETDGTKPGRIVHGTYQSPILVQWGKSSARTRTVRATLTALE